MRLRELVAVFVLGLAGCTSIKVSSLLLGAETYPPRPENHPIVVYETASDVPHPFVKVGRVSARRTPSTLIGELIDPMKEEARRLGADALVLSGGFEVSTTMEVRTKSAPGKEGEGATPTTRGTSTSGSVMWGHNAVAIRYVDALPGK